jgi:UDP-N-acetylmuramoyl-tripeptide--D-alanyl-D-alanine ligase
MLMTFAEAAGIPGAEIFSFSDCVGFESVCADSRLASPGALFAALPGAVCDGHSFVRDAFSRGAAGALVEKSKLADFALAEAARECSRVLIAVEDTLRSLQSLAAAYIDRFPALLRIGITGSSGKTTVKEIAAAMIGVEKRVIRNEGNLNSETGLPLSLFGVRKEHEVGIFELGMNRKGEIAELAGTLRPRIALITNTGSAHAGLVGGEEAVALEKKAVFSRFTGAETAILPDAGPFAELLALGINGNVRYFGMMASARFGGRESKGLDGSTIFWDGVPVDFALPGEHNVLNALAAAAIAESAGVSGEAIRAGIAAARPLFGRSELVEGEVTILRDCYNANPDSMERAIEVCDEAACPGRRIYVIGSMLELGSGSRAAHEVLGERLARSKADFVFLFGDETKDAYLQLVKEEKNKKVFFTNDMDELKMNLKNSARKGDLILLKGSRGCALERAV